MNVGLIYQTVNMKEQTIINKLPFNDLAFEIDQLNIMSLSIKAGSFIQGIKEIIATVNTLDKDQKSAELLSYIWADEAKEVAILTRDILLGLLKSAYLQAEGLKSEQEIITFKKASIDVLNRAYNTLQRSYEEKLNENGLIDDKWKHQTRPNTVIIKHLDILVDQLKKIQRCEHKLDKISGSFEEYRNNYIDYINSRIRYVEGIEQDIKTLSNELKEAKIESKKSEVLKLITEVDRILETIDNLPLLPSYEHLVLEDIDKLQLPIATDEGKLLFKNIDILSEVSTWSSFSLLTPLKKIDRLIVNYKEKTNVLLFQLSNRLKAKVESSTSDVVTFIPNELSKSLNKLIQDYELILVVEIKGPLADKKMEIETEMRINKLFNDQQSFLPVTTLGQFSSNIGYGRNIAERYKLENIREAFHKFTNGYFINEKSPYKQSPAAYVDLLTDFDAESDANILFMRRGFLGSSFTVNRNEELEAVDGHYRLWNKGYGGGLLIKGQPGSGRSTLLEILSVRYSGITSHSVFIEQPLWINGQKHMMDQDLIKTLLFIIKNKGAAPCIVAIDDLNQYKDKAAGLYDVMVELLNIVRRYSAKIYFAITMTDTQYNSIKNLIDLTNVFTLVVDTDHMLPNMISEAITMRAFAVAYHDELEYSRIALTERANKIAQLSQGNIGLAMQYWCNHHDDNVLHKQVFEEKVKKHAMILKYILREEKIGLSQLKDMLDTAQYSVINEEIQHLKDTKILTKLKRNYLEVNPILRIIVSQILKD